MFPPNNRKPFKRNKSLAPISVDTHSSERGSSRTCRSVIVSRSSHQEAHVINSRVYTPEKYRTRFKVCASKQGACEVHTTRRQVHDHQVTVYQTRFSLARPYACTRVQRNIHRTDEPCIVDKPGTGNIFLHKIN